MIVKGKRDTATSCLPFIILTLFENMAETKYIKYGNQEVDQDALNKQLADGVQKYVNSQPWSSKKKELFTKVYSDILKRGIRGASNDTGRWVIDIHGTPINFDGMDKKTREMYGEAAYFIQQQMAGLATAPKIEEKPNQQSETKVELPKFTNTKDNITRLIGNDLFGGQEFSFSKWRDRMEGNRGENGLFGVSNRRAEMVRQLQLYKDELTTNPLDFTGSAFKNQSDYQARLDNAIAALNDPNIDELRLKQALDKVGLNYDEWFDTGGNEIYGKDADGNPITYAQQFTTPPVIKSEEPEKEDSPTLETEDSEPETRTLLTRINKYREYIGGKNSTAPIQDGEIEYTERHWFGNTKKKAIVNTDSNGVIWVQDGSTMSGRRPFKTSEEAKKYLTRIFKKTSPSIENFDEETFDQFEKLGWLKQGGRLDRQKINKYKQYINK